MWGALSGHGECYQGCDLHTAERWVALAEKAAMATHMRLYLFRAWGKAHLWSFRKHVSGQGRGNERFAGLQGRDIDIFFLLDRWFFSSLATFLCF